MQPKPLFYHEPVAFIYIRVSTEYQVQTDSNSVETQKRLCMELCEKKNIPVSKIIEQVKSGRKDRAALVNVIKNDLTRGDVIVVYSISRFARSQKQVHDLVDCLRRKKCRLLTVAENMDTMEDDRFLGIYAWVAEMESKQIGERVKVSLQSKKLRGEHTGNIPYGYRFLNGKGSPLVENEEQMKVLAMMREWRQTGKSIYEITTRLNTQQIPPPKKTKTGGWNDRSVKLILERDENSILKRGKRSWYLEQETATRLADGGHTDGDEAEVEVESEGELTAEPEEEVAEVEVESEEGEAAGEDGEDVQNADGNAAARVSLDQRSTIVLRTMLMKRRDELGLSLEEIKGLSRDDIVDILCTV